MTHLAAMNEGIATSPSSDAPLVSVIVPTYNYGNFIGQTLESICAQTYQNWECIVVDDGSTDETPEVVARHVEKDGRIKYFRQQNQRQATATNTGLKNSVGQYLQFLDADDLVEARKFERQVEFLERHPDVDIVYGGVRFFSSENPDQRLFSIWEGGDRPWMPEVSGAGEEIVRALLRSNIMTINCPLVRRSTCEDVGLFDPKLLAVEDWDYWLRCALKGKRFQFADEPETLALVRAHPASSSRNRAHMYRAMLRMRSKLDTVIEEAEARRLNREQMAEDEGFLGVEYVSNGDLLRGLGGLFKAALLVSKPRWRVKWLACTLAAPFVPKENLRRMISTPLIQAVARTRRKSGSEIA